jgi:hypothetical protein
MLKTQMICLWNTEVEGLGNDTIEVEQQIIKESTS